jgi:SAM-dependent methyltransferase
MARAIAAMPHFLASYRRFKQAHRAFGADFALGKLYPCLNEGAEGAGNASGDYFHQDLLVAQRIFSRSPRCHADVGSRVDGFVAHVAVFRELDVFDVRPLRSTTANIHFRQIDLVHDTDETLVGAYDSVSCLHALEHFGLGRYGDALDYLGFVKGFRAITSLLCPGGVLYLSVPMGPQRIEFNAHRVFSLPYLRDLYREAFTLDRFSYVDDCGDLHENVAVTGPEADQNYDCWYGLAILELIRI